MDKGTIPYEFLFILNREDGAEVHLPDKQAVKMLTRSQELFIS
jgi:hypothetical protein